MQERLPHPLRDRLSLRADGFGVDHRGFKSCMPKPSHHCYFRNAGDQCAHRKAVAEPFRASLQPGNTRCLHNLFDPLPSSCPAPRPDAGIPARFVLSSSADAVCRIEFLEDIRRNGDRTINGCFALPLLKALNNNDAGFKVDLARRKSQDLGDPCACERKRQTERVHLKRSMVLGSTQEQPTFLYGCILAIARIIIRKRHASIPSHIVRIGGY